MTLSTASMLEAVLFTAGEAIAKKRLATLLDCSAEELAAAIQELSTNLTDHGLALVETSEEIELRTAPEAMLLVQKLRESELSRDLGKARLETLAVILYKQGATRGEIDWIRGVNSATAVRSLMLRGLITRSEDAQDKRRIRYTTTIEALAHLGVSRAEDLPNYAEFVHALSAQSDETAPQSASLSIDSHE
jgi:segregation and condensation protein B